ncbi:protein-methionine-sulfoxide reductase heme-binding subunit MsrQ [Pseudooceanicola sp. HF7]|uniref:protein-methionine-sulfoxide reductase heme-binding subunit MsrQ n=1 Tax=Pseudooceanicola sp. HF7 TaxID=2721560 RepID=UPI001431537C|nr:protein-methionine-sulfoxide reductase heme-binding subunit MsrQ [Pseudooceanicola sp. HF7]NIZ11489.1 protein-methionine-sulfoxide reductase heme-binding subunit MsrQ [Pseudooceanicola sp. HF7]
MTSARPHAKSARASSSLSGLRDAIGGPVNTALRRVPAWPLYILGVLPPAWLLWAGLTGQLGFDPVKAMEHQMGEWGLWLLIAGLCVTPARRYLGISLLRYRRGLGLLAFFYILGHMLIWLLLDVQILAQVWADILKRPYITIGMGAFVLMIPLALTSNNWSIRKLGKQWRQLHKLVYAVALLGSLHFILLVKGLQLEPLIYMAVIIGLLLLRLPRARKRRTA